LAYRYLKNKFIHKKSAKNAVNEVLYPIFNENKKPEYKIKPINSQSVG